jgi:hypothetical protein
MATVDYIHPLDQAEEGPGDPHPGKEQLQQPSWARSGIHSSSGKRKEVGFGRR